MLKFYISKSMLSIRGFISLESFERCEMLMSPLSLRMLRVPRCCQQNHALVGVTQPIQLVSQSNSRDGQKRAGFLKAKHVWSKTRFEILKDCEHFRHWRFKTV